MASREDLPLIVPLCQSRGGLFHNAPLRSAAVLAAAWHLDTKASNVLMPDPVHPINRVQTVTARSGAQWGCPQRRGGGSAVPSLGPGIPGPQLLPSLPW